jgi:3-hydroxyisobutyrate dehydrogenase-like beta-hydroxyacid dehydrogenase
MTTTAPESIGFVGAGLMGRGMIRNLLQGGCAVTIFVHKRREGIDELIALGARETSDLRALARQCSVIMLCLDSADTVRAVLAEMRPALSRGQLVIDATTSNPDVTMEVAAALKDAGVDYADAPVTGGPPEAAAGRLGTIVGCDEAVFARVERVVSHYAASVRRVGGVGKAHFAKLLNNFVTQGTAVLLAEAYGRAREAGVDWNALYALMAAGAARSGTFDKTVKPALEGNFEGSLFSIRNARKDVSYFCAQADNSARGPSELGAAIRRVLDDAVAAGCGERYTSALLDPDLKRR